ncbi:IucA/IucC family C-terminal-domain containing protein [Halalkalibacter sp. APA_J-10(15)]|uniref:IucA/IucC family C-terminal-domain containing protein n=1 Tax=Halalkalibacter sp. APA_J-10(15) TaxID=2933805 RepID=UPI001FF59404|nr:IucA/IucC family C-terminal-domain containing protein [Halalkalibacter sp. APA_J-10(15)]MCK0471713.1 (2Fe-2S)-binding protein [Halalkalibacter sp. APA_J-10(15)]
MSTSVIERLDSFDIKRLGESDISISTIDLLQEEKALAYLQNQKEKLNAPNLAVAASMLSKRYAYLVVSSTLYSMVELNGAPCFPMKACALTEKRALCINEDDCPWQEAHANREEWRTAVFQELFANHLTPLLLALQRVSRMPQSILWENVAVRINSTYRKALDDCAENETKKQSIYDDFLFLKGADGELFQLKENPIKPYLKIGEELHSNPTRQTCCMYYRLKKEGGKVSYCKVCPVKK